MSRIGTIGSRLLKLGDRRVLEVVFAAVSISPERLRSQLRAQQLAYCAPGLDEQPSLHQLDQTAKRLIKLARDNATALGGIAGAAGLVSLPPEILAHVVTTMRLGQRLAVVYGFDTETDAGKMVLWQALANGFDVEFPDRGPMAARVSDVFARSDHGTSVSSTLAQAMVRRSGRLIGGRFNRLLPLVASGPAALAARRRIERAGERMHTTFRQLAELPVGRVQDIEDAIEIDP